MTNLRRATATDAADLTRLRGLMLEAMGRGPLTPTWAQACDEAFVRRLAEGDRFAAWVVDVDGRPVSCGVGWIEEHLPSPGCSDGRRGHIASMSTEPGHRRRGYGRRVLTALMAWFEDLAVPRVDLRATDDGRPLYVQLGFRELAGATMAWTATPGAAPGLGFADAATPQ